MNKEKLTESIKNIKDGIKAARANKELAAYHEDEGNIILKALEKELTLL